MNETDKPSASIDEAIERLSKTANDSIDDLIARILQVTKQRDDLAWCLREVSRALESGLFVIPMDKLAEGMTLLNRCNAAFLHTDVLHHLEAAADAQAKEGTARHD